MQDSSAKGGSTPRSKPVSRRTAAQVAALITALVVLGFAAMGLRAMLFPTAPALTVVSVQFLVEVPDAAPDWTIVPVPAGTDVWRATSVTYEVEADWYPEFGSHLVRSIDGLHDTPELYWTLWLWNVDDKVWDHAQVGADHLSLDADMRIAWLYGTLDAIPSHLEPPLE